MRKTIDKAGRPVEVRRRLVARPTTEVHARPSVDIAGLVENERNRWPPAAFLAGIKPRRT